MNYLIRYYKRKPLDPQDRWTIHRETISAKAEAEARDIIECCDNEVIDCTLQDAPLSVGDFDLDTIVTKDLEKSFNDFMGPLEPPNDYRIYNRKQADGTYPTLSKFFDDAVSKADAGKQEIETTDLGTHTGILGGDVFEFGSKEWFDNINPLPY